MGGGKWRERRRETEKKRMGKEDSRGLMTTVPDSVVKAGINREILKRLQSHFLLLRMEGWVEGRSSTHFTVFSDGGDGLVGLSDKIDADTQDIYNEYCANSFSNVDSLGVDMSVVVEKDVELRGEIVAWDKDERKAKIKTPNSVIPFTIPKTISEEVIEDSFSHYSRDRIRTKYLVISKGKAVYGADGELVEYVPETLEKLRFIDSVYRLQELSLMEDNWDNEGALAPDKEGLGWLESFFRNIFPPNLRPPYIFPDEEGNLTIEWDQDGNDMAFLGKINLKTHRLEGFWFSDADNDNETDISINLDDAQEVEKLWPFIRVYGENFDAR